MSFTVKDYRRARFEELLNGPPFNGDRAKLMKAAGLSKGRITQLLDPKEPFGDNAAKRLVEKLGLPKGYFDRRQGSLSPGAVAVARAFDEMTEKQQSVFLKLLEATFGADESSRPGELGGPIDPAPSDRTSGRGSQPDR